MYNFVYQQHIKIGIKTHTLFILVENKILLVWLQFMNQLGAIYLKHLITIRLILEKDFHKKNNPLYKWATIGWSSVQPIIIGLVYYIKKMVDIWGGRERGHFAILDKITRQWIFYTFLPEVGD